MTTRSRLEAELATQRYTRRHAREIVTAILGNNAGTVVATASTRWYWIRLHGDSNQVVRAWNTGFVPPVPNLPVDVEIVKANNITDYQIIGVSINKGVAADVNSGATGSHALQHQRRDFNEGGFDPLDIYTRAIIPLRARAQATPNMTLYVEPGFYSMLGVETYWAGGNSPAFVAPATGYRIDLLYLNAAGALTILTGTAAPFAPVRPATPTAGIVPIAYVYLAAATTAVTEYDIEDARVAFGSSGASGANALLDGVNHTDTLAGTVVDGDVIIGNVTPKWSRLAISIPAAGTLNYLGVNNGELRPSWKSASNSPGAAAAILATNSGGLLTLQNLNTVGDIVDGYTACPNSALVGRGFWNVRTAQSELGLFAYYSGVLGASYRMIALRGTPGSESATQATDGGQFVFTGHDGTAFTGAVCRIQFVAVDNFTTTAHGAKLLFDTTPAGSITIATRLTIDDKGNLVPGTAALATNATDGFLYIPSCNGTPNGTPTAYTGRIPIVYDYANNYLYVYNGGWKKSTAYA